VARFDLYEGRKTWWWVFFLSLAVAKDSPSNYAQLVSMLFDAIDYEDNYESTLKRKGILDKYDIKEYRK